MAVTANKRSAEEIKTLIETDWEPASYVLEDVGDDVLPVAMESGWHRAAIYVGGGQESGWAVVSDECYGETNLSDPTYAEVRDAGLLGLVEDGEWADDDMIEREDLTADARQALYDALGDAEGEREEAEDEAYVDLILHGFDEAEGYVWIMPSGWGNVGYCVAWRPGERPAIDEYTDKVFAANYPNCLMDWWDLEEVREALIKHRSTQRHYDRVCSGTDASGPSSVQWLAEVTR